MALVLVPSKFAICIEKGFYHQTGLVPVNTCVYLVWLLWGILVCIAPQVDVLIIIIIIIIGFLFNVE